MSERQANWYLLQTAPLPEIERLRFECERDEREGREKRWREERMGGRKGGRRDGGRKDERSGERGRGEDKSPSEEVKSLAKY